MKINESSKILIDFKGIYSITSSKNKRYIGSTKKSFAQRLKSHYEKLRTNNHQNEHLQSSYNKYGVECFTFEVLEVIDNDVEIREGYWIDFYKSYDREYGYNINKNPLESPSLTEEVKVKISNTLKRKYKNGELEVNDTIFKKGSIPWNKGINYNSTEHLRVPKTLTEKSIQRCLNNSKRIRESQPSIEVYDIDYNFINVWNSAKDLEDFSKSEYNDLPIKSRFTKERNNIPLKQLQSSNINKACKTGNSYKNLYFKWLYQAHDKQDELLETPTLERQKEDNQQPNLDSNIFEGSTTNIRILPNNVEDSNDNTSVLH
jgi:group I intron endonuclease